KGRWPRRTARDSWEPYAREQHEVHERKNDEHEQARHHVRRRRRGTPAPAVGIKAPPRTLADTALHAVQKIDLGRAPYLRAPKDGSHAFLRALFALARRLRGALVVLVRHPIFSPRASSTACFS